MLEGVGNVLVGRVGDVFCLLPRQQVGACDSALKSFFYHLGPVFASKNRFVDDSNSPTEAYPFNPNGSPDGIAGLCSEDGRHLAVMPHPERCFLKWQVSPPC